MIAPATLHLLLAHSKANRNIKVAAQNVHDKTQGAYTGEISVSQIKEIGINWTILGHSERRTLLSECDKFVASKAKNAIENKVKVILCCGESLEVSRLLVIVYCILEITFLG